MLALDLIYSDLSPKQSLAEFSRHLSDELYRNLRQTDGEKNENNPLNNNFSEISASYMFSYSSLFRIGKYMCLFSLEEFKIENIEIISMDYRLTQAIVAKILPM